MGDWHLTWQDPVAALLAALGLGLAWWLHRRWAGQGSCGTCGDEAASAEADAKPRRVSVESTRMGRR